MRKNAGTDATFIKASEPWLNPRRIRRQALRAGRLAQPQPALPAGTGRSLDGQHGWRKVQAIESGLRIARLQRVETAATTAPQIDDPLRLYPDVIEALLHPAIDFAGEEIALMIASRDPGKTPTDLLAVDEPRTQTAFTPRRANKRSSRSTSGLPVVSRRSP